MLNSGDSKQMTLAADFCHYLLFHDKNLSMNDLVGYDQKARDFIIKQDMVKVWTTLNSTMGPTSNQLKDLTMRRAKSNLSAYSAGDFVRDRLIDEEEIKRNIAAGFSDKLGKVKVVDQGSLQPVIEEIKAEETAETPPTQAELLIHVVGPRLSTMRANSRAGSRQ